MRSELFVLALFAMVLFFVPIYTLLSSVIRYAFKGRHVSFRQKIVLMGCVVLWGALAFRPHGDTFVALDNSGYRLMSYAFLQGRGFHEHDQMLQEAPVEIRQALMYLPLMTQRNTRDISFQTYSLDKAKTGPFFYPLVPLLAAGVDRVVPFMGMDHLMPLLSLLLILSLVALGWSAGRSTGSILAFVLVIGSPLPIWLFRGFYPEAAGAACMALVLSFWYLCEPKTSHCLCAGLLLGLAVSLHPVYIVLAVPLVAALALDAHAHPRHAACLILGFCSGVVVLLSMTHWIAAPYGAFSMQNMLINFRFSAAHRLVLLFGMGVGAVTVLAFFTRPLWYARFVCLVKWLPVRVLILLFGAVPLFYAATKWQNAPLVRVGLKDALSGLQLPLAVLLVSGAAICTFRFKNKKSFVLLTIFIFSLPVFLYLKGAEEVGLWSQRRLLPSYILLILGVLPELASWSYQQLQKRMGGYPVCAMLLFGGLFVASFHNMVRWPAPYFVRVDHRALAFVEQIKEDVGERVVMFDYHPFSCPFAVDNRTRAIGIGQRSRGRLDGVSSWLADRACEEEVLWATAFDSPGLEDSVLLTPVALHTGRFDRVISRGALPAEKRHHDIRIELLRAIPLQAPMAGLVVDKVLDSGPLALREPWGFYRRTLTDADGNVLPVEWSRDGSGIVGPVPPAGGAVKFTIWATSGQDVPQIVEIVSPWSEERYRLQVDAEFSAYSLQIPRAADCDWEGATGVYRMNIPSPYDPSLAGIRGFERDLGVLTHRIRIESL